MPTIADGWATRMQYNRARSYFARMRLFVAMCSSSARPSGSIRGGMYAPKRPRNRFVRPNQSPGRSRRIPMAVVCDAERLRDRHSHRATLQSTASTRQQ